MKRCLKAHDVTPAVVEAVVQFYESGVDKLNEDCDDFPLESIITATGIFEAVDFYHPDLESGLNSMHWLMEANVSDKLVSCLSTYPPYLTEWVTFGLGRPKWSSLDTDSLVQLEMLLNSTISRSISSACP